MGIVNTKLVQVSPIRVMVSQTIRQAEGGGGPEGPEIFTETGTNGDIALNGTNELTAGSYTSSSVFNLDHPAGAFDGWVNGLKINTDAGVSYLRGIWLSDVGQVSNQWLAIDLGRVASVSSYRMLMTNSTALVLGRMPQNIKIQKSIDGVNYTDHEELVNPQLENTGIVSFDNPVVTRYFRFFMVDTYTAADYMQVGEIELYQTQ